MPTIQETKTTTEQAHSATEAGESRKQDNAADKSPWNSLEVAKLAASLITPIAVLILGYMITSSAKVADDRRAQQLHDTDTIRRRQDAVIDLSRFIYERRSRAELLGSALRRHAVAPNEDSRREVMERKRAYDAAYVEWNANSQAILLRARSTIMQPVYSRIENVIEESLVQRIFAPLDSCLTQAFDITIRNGEPRPILDNCSSRALLQSALDCGYAITNGLYLMASDLTPEAISKETAAGEDIEHACH
jgi:hypothetical protein